MVPDRWAPPTLSLSPLVNVKKCYKVSTASFLAQIYCFEEQIIKILGTLELSKIIESEIWVPQKRQSSTRRSLDSDYFTLSFLAKNTCFR